MNTNLASSIVCTCPQGRSTTPGGAILYWHVDDVTGTLKRLKELGATAFEPPTQRGEGFHTASVMDPFGNILGIMYNPHYLKVLHKDEQPEPFA